VITFVPDTHEYFDASGQRWPSVTETLERVGLVDFSSIPKPIRLAALARGSRVHRAAHFLTEGTLDWNSVADEEKGYVEACALFLATSEFEIAGQERLVWHPKYRYAGTTDAFGWWRGQLALADWCTGDLHDAAKCFQTSAYAEALRCNPPAEWLDFTPTSPIVRVGVRLHKNGKFTPDVYDDPNDWMKFLAAVTIVREQMARGLKGRKAA
jgi:hypothetical protein